MYSLCVEGLNGRLPNQDFINSFITISRYTGGVPVVLYDHLDPRESSSTDNLLGFAPSWLPLSVQKLDSVKEYAVRARNVARHVGYQARGRASGVHGLFHRLASLCRLGFLLC
jgi:glycosylphosphatidylinositol transamidase